METERKKTEQRWSFTFFLLKKRKNYEEAVEVPDEGEEGMRGGLMEQRS